MKKIIFITFLLFIKLNNVYAIENRIIYKIENQIITSVDIKNEFRYLIALNNGLKDLKEEQIYNISRQSIIKEKIKKVEILKNFKIIDIDDKYMVLLLKNIYSKLGIDNYDDFTIYLKEFNVEPEYIKEKIIIDALWNDLILQKYSSKVEINKKKIVERINKNQRLTTKDYFLSEIIFEVKNKNEINTKFNTIRQSINEIGFENTSSIYSISETSKVGGKIGWVNEKSFNTLIKNEILILKKNDITKPIITPNGILILKIDNIREVKVSTDFDKELKKMMNYERNKQLSQYSKIYFNKIKQNLEFNE